MNRLNQARRPARVQLMLLVPVAALFLAAAGFVAWRRATVSPPPSPPEETAAPASAKPRYVAFDRFGFWWGDVPELVRANSSPTGTFSNIEPQDYAGAAACRDCHAQQHQAWSDHPHRWMNAAATPDAALGAFSGQARLRYLGGEGRFWREGDHFRMAVERGPLRRVFPIRRTIGRRFFQYYVGVQTVGPSRPSTPATGSITCSRSAGG